MPRGFRLSCDEKSTWSAFVQTQGTAPSRQVNAFLPATGNQRGWFCYIQDKRQCIFVFLMITTADLLLPA